MKSFAPLKSDIQAIVELIKHQVTHPIHIMEVCGTHTMSIFRHGIRSLLPKAIKLMSGPGCPVCVTPQSDLDRFILAARQKNVIIASFGDLFRVPANHSTLLNERSQGHDIRVVYSPMDALVLAKENPDQIVIFLAVGFETTAPAVAATIIMAQSQHITNFYILSAHRRVVPALERLMQHPETKIDGFLLPGHVSTIIGEIAYQHIPSQFGIGGVIAGFDAGDILYAIHRLISQIQENRPSIENAYPRAVHKQGNKKANAMINQVFSITDARWRGIGIIVNSGLTLNEEYACYDANKRFDLEMGEAIDPKGCQCGDILMGLIKPSQCQLFGTTCTPQCPVGPCMVSSEGTCAAFYRYEYQHSL
jgi:hydrogenase expression/formation protein HypD